MSSDFGKEGVFRTPLVFDDLVLNQRMWFCLTLPFLNLTVILSQSLQEHPGGLFLFLQKEANGVILAAQQGDVQSFQFWVFLHWNSKLQKCCCYRHRRNK